LLHFLVAGAALFGIHRWLEPGEYPNAGPLPQVHISEGDVSSLRQTWKLQWQREPTTDDLRGAVSQLLNERLLALEAHSLGLDENDTIGRRRLAQKLSFVIEGTTRILDPTEHDLEQFYASHADQFRTEARVSFTQVYFSPTRREDPAGDARAGLANLSAQGDNELEATMGDRLLLGSHFQDEGEQVVSKAFGREFAQALFRLALGTWSGPVESGYGLHLVRVSALNGSRLLPFAEVRAQVLEAWRRDREKAANEQYLAGLRKKYNAAIDDGVKTLIGDL
jgi:hypothetical protein